MTWAQLSAEVLLEGSAIKVWENLREPSLLPDAGSESTWSQAVDEVAQWRSSDLQFVSILDDGYPEQLRSVREAPAILFYRGDLRQVDPGMSVVGSRKASQRGIEIAGVAAGLLVDRGLSVIAGLAEGIDTAAHLAALERGGRTVAVIGTGITKYYPEKNQALQNRISREGLVVSQFRPDASPTKQSFPMRNAVMSGYGMGTIIVEAGERSGTRIQARNAVEHGRPVILTDTVVEQTSWGRALVGRPDVHVVSGADELGEVIDRIRDRKFEIENTIQRLLRMPVA